jgi:hypothetical protein
LKTKSREPSIPAERHETLRRRIISALMNRALSSKEISVEVGISEKETYAHLEHIQKTMNKKDHHLAVTPAQCRKCGFIFKKRQRLKKPGKCPACRSELIQGQLFSIRENE